MFPDADTAGAGNPGGIDDVSIFHVNAGSMGFADGHAAWLPGNKVVETNDKSPLRGGPILPPIEVIWDLYTY